MRERRHSAAGLTRRAVLGGLAAVAAPQLAPARESGSLDVLAEARGLFYGSAGEGIRFADDPAYGELFLAECGAVVPEWTMKWGRIQRQPGRFDFSDADATVAYAQAHGLRLRCHTLFWHQSMPGWLDGVVGEPGAWDRHVAPYVEAWCGRFGRHALDMDILNEALDPESGRTDGLRENSFTAAFGEDFVVRAFAAARRLAPEATLFYNDFGYDYAGGWADRRRRGTLVALERWLKAGVPVGGLGIQAHLVNAADHRFDARVFRRFLRDAADLGLTIVISELDVRESAFGRSIAERDRRVADETRRYLDVALDEAAVSGLMTWGLADRYTWLHDFHDPRNRGLPYDADLAPKPMRNAIARALSGAPVRRPRT